MAQVETYGSLEEKGEAFEQINVKTKSNLDEIINTFNNNTNGELIFRGCKKANYKLFTKAQREWKSKELYNLGYSFLEFIKNEIINARKYQDNLLDKFFSAFGQPANDLIILGFLQHYGAPTTLLDWTYSFDNSLFFASDSLEYATSSNEIENYFSVYVIDNNANKISNHIDFVRRLSENQIILNGERNESLTKNLLQAIGEFDYLVLYSQFISLLPGYKMNGFQKEFQDYSYNLFYNQQNLNIINQQGLFIYNGSEDKPLEHYFQGRPVNGFTYTFNFSKIKCFNIHQSLLKYTLKLLNDRKPYPINRDFIFPQEEMIAKNAFQQMLNFEYQNNE